MVDVAISSSRRIAESWGLTARITAPAPGPIVQPEPTARSVSAASTTKARFERLGQVKSKGGWPSDGSRVIEDALRAGELMK